MSERIDNVSDNGASERGTWTVKAGLAQMLKGGVIMDVVSPEHARIAEEAGACAVMALERVPADIRKDGGVARMSDPEIIVRITEAVSIPVMAKARIGHFVEASVLQALGVDYIDESEVLTPADEAHHIDKHAYTVPFVCGCRDLGEALRRIAEGAAMIRTKGEAGTGDIVEAVRHMRAVQEGIRGASLPTLREHEIYAAASRMRVPAELVKRVRDEGRLPVVNFAAGGVATPADAALMMRSAPTACSWARASSSRRTRPPSPTPSSRPSPTTRTTSCSRRSLAASAPPCAASPSPPSPRKRSSPKGVGSRQQAFRSGC